MVLLLITFYSGVKIGVSIAPLESNYKTRFEEVSWCMFEKRSNADSAEYGISRISVSSE